MYKDEKIILHNLEFTEESVSSDNIAREIFSVDNLNFKKISFYDMQKSALDWNWYEFSWFSEEKKYRKLIYNNMVPIYKIPKNIRNDGRVDDCVGLENQSG